MNVLQFIGALAFGLVVGWTTYFILRRAQPKALSDLTTFIGAIGGAAVTTLFDSKGSTFAGYAIGLALGFLAYYLVFLWIVGVHAIRESLKADGPVMLTDKEKKEAAFNVSWGAKRKS